MITEASEDSKGRKVVYYRVISKEKFLAFLKDKKQTVESYFKNPEAELSQDHKEGLQDLLLDYAGDIKKSDMSELDDLKTKTLQELFFSFFDNTEGKVEQLIKNLNYKNVIKFLKQNVEVEFLKRKHSGSFSQVFSSFLSLSVGGIINTAYLDKNDKIYLEIVMPDEKIIPHYSARVQGEKEVFTEEIDFEFISRAFTSRDQFFGKLLKIKI